VAATASTSDGVAQCRRVRRADDHRARGFEPFDRDRVLAGGVVRERGQPQGVPDAGRPVPEVLDRDRDAVERAEILARRGGAVGPAGALPCRPVENRDVRVQVIAGRDAVENRLDDIDTDRCNYFRQSYPIPTVSCPTGTSLFCHGGNELQRSV
jgi:hypothetical protein